MESAFALTANQRVFFNTIGPKRTLRRGARPGKTRHWRAEPLKLKELAHGTRTTVLWFEGDADTSLSSWYSTLIGMIDALDQTSDFKLSKHNYRADSGEFVLKGVDFEWSNGVAAIWSDIPHEIIIVFDGSLRPRKAEALVEALMAVWNPL